MKLIQGELWDSILMNPIALLTLISLGIIVFWLVRDLVRGERTCLQALQKDWHWAVKLPLFALLILNWIWNIYKGL